MKKQYDPYTDDPEVVKAINQMADDIRATIDAELIREITGIAEGWKTPSYAIVKNDVIKSIVKLREEVEHENNRKS